MQFVRPLPFEEAERKLGERSPVGSMLRSRDWQRVPVGLRERAFFSATVEDVRWLGRRKDFLERFLSGHTDTNERGERYFTAGGRAKFIEEAQREAIRSGMGPLDPRDKGTLKDVTSERRLALIFDHNTRAASDFGYWKQGQDPDVLDAFPAQRFIRAGEVKEPRLKHEHFEGQAARKDDLDYWLNINQDFGLPWGPWGWGCEHDVEDVGREESDALGLTRPDELLAPAEADFNERLEASTRGLDQPTQNLLRLAFGERVEIVGDSVRWKNGAAPPPQKKPVPPNPPIVKQPAMPSAAPDNSADALLGLRDLESDYEKRRAAISDPAELQKLESDRLAAARDLVSVPAGERGAVKFAAKVPPSLKANTAHGAQIVERYTAKDLLPKITVKRLNPGARAYYLSGTRSVHYGKYTHASTVAHEITHGTETQHPDVLKASREFLALRAGSETPKKLSQLTGNHHYAASEIAFEDEWAARGGSHYSGKIYPHATELLSMGIERLHADPIAFARTDPDYFKFVTKNIEAMEIMKVTIEIDGTRATYDGKWHCDDPATLETIQKAESALPPGYRPNPFADLASEVAAALGGRVIEADPMPASDAPEDAVY